MDPLLTALFGLVQPVLGFIGGLDKNRTVKDIATGQQQVDVEKIKAELELGKQQLWSQERLAQLEAMLKSAQAYETGQTNRTRAYYSFATARELRGTYVAVAGVAMIGLALYYGRKNP